MLKLRFLLLSVAASCLWFSAGAQPAVTGKVVSSGDGLPLPGVSVVVKGSGQGTATDGEGNFSINAGAGETLVFSFLGFQNKEVILSANAGPLTVQMDVETSRLDEVVVTALGIERETKALGYSVGEVSADELEKVPQENVLNALTGKVAGLKISNTNGDLNSETQVVIRGRKSLTGSDAPLIVIDGLPTGNDANVIADLSANNIESVTVLKGPSAAALYGSRAGNGVLLITTKSGEGYNKGLGVSFNSGYTAAVPYRFLEQQHRFSNGINGEFDESSVQQWWGAEEGSPEVQWNTNGEAVPLKFYGDAPKKFFGTGNTFINDVSVYGSNEKGSFRLSLSDMRGNGTYPGTELTKNAADLAATYNIVPDLKVSANVHIMSSSSDNFSVQSHDDYQYQDIFFIPNHINIEDLRDYWEEPGIQQKVWGDGYNNPYFVAYENLDKFSRVRAYGNVKLDWTISDEWSLMTRIGNYKDNHITQGQYSWSDKRYPYGSYTYVDDYREETNADMLLSYKKDVGDFSVNISGGGNLFFLHGSNVSNDGDKLTLPGLYTVSNIERGFLNYSSYLKDKRVNSVYGLASFDYKDAIYLELTARNDWSSTLPPNNRSYFYPSASLSVLLSEMLELPDFVSFFKLRAGWAEVGRDTEPYQLTQTLNKNNWGDNIAYSLGESMLNQNLKPETAVSSEAGVDLSLFNNRLGVEFTYYKTSNQDQILNVNIPSMTQYRTAQINAGIVENSGIELALHAVPVQTKSFTWDINFEFTKDRSKLEELTEGIDVFQFWESTGIFNRTAVGEYIGDMWGYDVLRVKEGEYKDWPLLNANGYVQRDPEMKKIGNVINDFTLGFQTNFSYKRLSLSASFDWRQGGQYYSMSMLRETRGGRQENWHKGPGSSTFTGILSNLSYNGNLEQIAAEIEANPAKYNGMDGLTWVGGRTADLGGFALDGRDNGAFFPGVRSDGNGGYIENFGGTDTKYFRAGLIADPGAGYWSQGVQTWLYDASFIKMREVSLAYKFPDKIAGSIKAQALSLSLFMRNLIIWTKAKNDIDPETAYLRVGDNTLAQGFDRWNVSPWTATMGLKLNVQF